MRKGLFALAGLGAGVAGLELFNRRVTLPRDRVRPQLPVEPVTWSWRFGDIAVYETGDPSNPPLLMLHGHNAAASAGEMLQPFQRLSGRFHVFAPDLLGYGLSDRPNVDYSPQLYIELIEDLLREVVQQPAAVLASSLTSAHAIEVAANNPDWVNGMVLVCPTGVRSLTGQPAAGKVMQAVLSVPVIGQAIFYGIASRPSIAYFLKNQTYFNSDCVTGELVDRYYETAHAPGAQYAPSAFVSGKLYWDASDAWTRLTRNVLLVWGREAKITPLAGAQPFLATNPASSLEVLDHAGILPHDEQPEQFANIVGEWLQRQ